MGKNQYTVPHNDRRAIKIAWNTASNQGSEVFIHHPNGQIWDSDSYVIVMEMNQHPFMVRLTK
jgi:hypothetical protein